MVNNKPLLRFNGFDNSWEFKNLGKLANILNGSRITKTDLKNNGKYLAVSGGETAFGRYDNYNFDENTITIARYGSAGFINYWKEKIWANDVTYCLVLNNLLDSLYLYNYLKYKQQHFYENITIATPSHLPRFIIHELTTPIPSLPEQTKIGKLFNNIDILIENEENKIHKLLDIKKSLLNKMFPLENVYIPSIRFNGYSDDWEVKKLGDYLYDPLLTQLNVIKSEQIITLSLNLGGIRSGSSKNGIYFGATKYFVRHSGQLLYGKQNFFNGSMAIIGEEFDGKGTSGDVPSFDIKHIDRYFLYYYIARPQYYEDKERESIGTGSKRIHQSTLKQFAISNPENFSEQHKIGKLFNKLENLANLYISKISKLKIIKQSLLKAMFV